MATRMLARGAFAGALALAALAACGGGGNGGSTAVPVTPGASAAPPAALPSAVVTAPAAAPAGQSAARFTVTIPAGTTASARRSPSYIAAGTKAIGITLLRTDAPGAATGTPQIFPVDATQSYCISGSAGLACTLTYNAPVGNDIFTATTYSDSAGTQRIGSGAVAMAVQLNASNSAALTLGGPIASAVLVSDGTGSSYYNPLLAGATPTPVPTSSATPNPYMYVYSPKARLYVVGVDTNRNAIVAPDSFSTPITLTIVAPAYSYGYSSQRAPRGIAPSPSPNPTPPPVVTPTPLPPSPTPTPIPIVITVTHRDGSTASSAGGKSVQVNAPDDVVVVTPVNTTQGGNYSFQVGVQASVGSVASSTVNFTVQPALCGGGYTGTQPNCTYNYPTPPPLLGCPAAGQYVVGTPPSYQYCAARTFAFTSVTPSSGSMGLNSSYVTSPAPPALPIAPATIQFPSITDTRTATVYLTANDPADTGYVNLAQSGGTCTGLTFSPALGTNVVASSPGHWSYAVAISTTTPPTAGFFCVVTATDPYTTLQAQLTINVNNLTQGVTIQ